MLSDELLGEAGSKRVSCLRGGDGEVGTGNVGLRKGMGLPRESRGVGCYGVKMLDGEHSRGLAE